MYFSHSTGLASTQLFTVSFLTVSGLLPQGGSTVGPAATQGCDDGVSRMSCSRSVANGRPVRPQEGRFITTSGQHRELLNLLWGTG